MIPKSNITRKEFSRFQSNPSHVDFLDPIARRPVAGFGGRVDIVRAASCNFPFLGLPRVFLYRKQVDGDICGYEFILRNRVHRFLVTEYVTMELASMGRSSPPEPVVGNACYAAMPLVGMER